MMLIVTRAADFEPVGAVLVLHAVTSWDPHAAGPGRDQSVDTDAQVYPAKTSIIRSRTSWCMGGCRDILLLLMQRLRIVERNCRANQRHNDGVGSDCHGEA
jgi:hypothetical protein